MLVGDDLGGRERFTAPPPPATASRQPCSRPAGAPSLRPFPWGVVKAECSLALLPAVWPRQRVQTPLLPHSFELVLLPPAPWGVSPFPPSARHLRASGWPRSGHTSLTLVSLPSLLATELVCGGHPTSYVSGPGRPHPWVARALVKCGAARGHTPGLGWDAFGASRGGAVLPPAPCGWVGGRRCHGGGRGDQWCEPLSSAPRSSATRLSRTPGQGSRAGDGSLRQGVPGPTSGSVPHLPGDLAPSPPR